MDRPSTIASQVFGYLKQTVVNLTELKSQEDGEQTMPRNSSPTNGEQPIQKRERNLALEGREKRKQWPLSPSRGTKRQKSESNSTVMFSETQQTFSANSSSQVEGECSANSQEDIEEDPGVRLKSIFNQLLWTLKYLKYNPFKTNEEMLEMVETLCNGLEKSLCLSRSCFTDQDFRRLVRVAETLFGLIRSHEDQISLFMVKRIHRKVEQLFESFLDHFNVDSDAEGHLRTYGFISLLIDKTKDDKQVIKKLVDKLLIRIYSTTTALWKACISSCPKGSVQLVHPEDINLFFYYCQLLEVLVTSTVSSLPSQTRLQEFVHQSLTALEEDAGSLFSLLPNLAYMLYSTILATGIHTKATTNISPLKAIQGI